MNANEKVAKELNRSTKNFIQHMQEYAGRKEASAPQAGCWDIRQVIEHVILVDRSVLALLQKPFHQKKSGHHTKYHLRDLLLNRHQKIKSREVFSPGKSTDQNCSELLKEFKILRQEIIDQVSSGQIDVDSDEAYPHDKLGLLTRRDWLYMICYHGDRHIAQTQEMLFVS